jgi:hypothetical protein
MNLKLMVTASIEASTTSQGPEDSFGRPVIYSVRIHCVKNTLNCAESHEGCIRECAARILRYSVDDGLSHSVLTGPPTIARSSLQVVLSSRTYTKLSLGKTVDASSVHIFGC